jgi:hypothetical protein
MRSVVVSMCVSSRDALVSPHFARCIPAVTECFGAPLRSACDTVASLPSALARRANTHSRVTAVRRSTQGSMWLALEAAGFTRFALTRPTRCIRLTVKESFVSAGAAQLSSARAFLSDSVVPVVPQAQPHAAKKARLFVFVVHRTPLRWSIC